MSVKYTVMIIGRFSDNDDLSVAYEKLNSVKTILRQLPTK